MDDEEERRARPDGHRYDAPESPEETRSKRWDYAILGILVVVILILIATGVEGAAQKGGELHSLHIETFQGIARIVHDVVVEYAAGVHLETEI